MDDGEQQKKKKKEMSLIRQKTQEDDQLKQVKYYKRNGWPESKDICHTLAEKILEPQR